MVQRVATVAFEGIEVRPVDVQVQVAPGMPAFAIVGLPDKAVSEARVTAVTAADLILPPPAEGSREVAERVALARTPGCPLCCDRAAAHSDQRRRFRCDIGRRRAAGRQRIDAAARSRRCNAAFGARRKRRRSRPARFRCSADHPDPLPWTEPRIPIADKNSWRVSA
jgi:hypothetical protein